MWQRARRRFLSLWRRLKFRLRRWRWSRGAPFNGQFDWQAWQAERERRRLERVRRRIERKTMDRQFFGEELWGAAGRQRRAALDEAKLQRFDLPVLRTERDLAEWLGSSLPRLRWFTHDKPADRVWHYIRYEIPKRGGGQRVILAPKRELKALQRKMLDDILVRIPASANAHGFVPGRSIVTNAQPHTGKEIVLNLDLKDFFPSLTFPRVRGALIALGYPFPVASALALLCTEHEREAFDRDGERFFVSVGPRHLVQGAPTSPALANLIAWRLDRRLEGLARKYGFAYTRYADDLTFSGQDFEAALRILDAAQRIVGDEHFAVNESKTRLYRRSSKQMVTGLVVNDRLNTPRKLRRRLRAILHNARQTSLENQNRDRRENFRAYLAGQIGFVQMANAREAEQLKEALHSLDQ
jgi:RNA-directed DNA polymerase